MEAPSTPAPGFTSPKKQILGLLKRNGQISLRDLASGLGVSKVAALRHLTHLEAEGLVVRQFRAGTIGRPQVYFRLTDQSARLFPAAYAEMSLHALEFIERKLGRPAVVQLLRQRTQELYRAYRSRVQGPALAGRVAELARIRDQGGYMAEIGPVRKGTHQLLEHNCPILAIAGEYGEACEVERNLFRSLLGAEVDVTHRAAAGDSVCRFLIRAAPETHV